MDTNSNLDSILEEINQLENAKDRKIPKWARALVTCFRGLIEELRSVKKLTRRIEELENAKQAGDQVNRDLEKQNGRLLGELDRLKVAYGDQEVRSNNYSVLLQFILFITMVLTGISFLQVFGGIIVHPLTAWSWG